MRTTIRISKELVIFLLFLIAGIFCVACGMISMQKEKCAIDIHELDATNCVKGTYVKGTYVKGYFDSYITKNYVNLGNGGTSAIHQVLIDGMKEYGFVTVPIQDNRYIQVMISDKDIVQQLEHINPNEIPKMYIEGEIVKAPVDVNYKWYEDSNAPEGFHVEDIVADYVMKQIDFADKTKWLYAGISFLLCSILLYKSMGGFAGILEKEKVVEASSTHTCSHSYNRENELIIEKMHEEALKEKRQKLKIGCLCRLPILVLGIFIVEDNYYWEIKFIGIVICVLALKGIVKCIISLDLRQ